MSIRLTVTPEELRAEANRVQSTTPLYVNAYNTIYRDVDSLRAAGWWRGEAHDSFSNQINEFKKDFKALESLLEDDFRRVLDSSGLDYGRTEDYLKVAATGLPVDSR